ncbi:hypothetical protein DID80_07950 [Candidatus Marinamargulisbacteria bacterium SCGC AAA071-K20]|nr:hypothetical protein DID80_07950 [Candidatus Marinamargulisbacteria bacterium SCGC AAA071-K20]
MRILSQETRDKEATICPLTALELTDENTFILNCGSVEIKVSRSFIVSYSGEMQREFKTPNCPFCRDEGHYGKALKEAGLYSKPFRPEDITTYEGIFMICEEANDLVFAALSAYNIISDQERDKAYTEICGRLIVRNEINMELDSDNTRIIHQLAQDGYKKHIIILVRDYGMNPHAKLKDGRTAADIAHSYGKEETRRYLVDELHVEQAAPTALEDPPESTGTNCTIM